MNWTYIAIFIASTVMSGCVENEAESAPKPAVELSFKRTYEGRVIAANATELRAPQNTFRVAGWNSDSSWIKLKKITEDGESVKAGDVVGGFEFRGKEALPRVREAIDRASNNQSKSSLDDRQELAGMRTGVAQRKLEQEGADLDTQRGTTVSQRDLKTFEIGLDVAKFEVAASEKTTRAYRAAVAAEKAYHESQVSRAEGDMKRFKTYEQRFVVKAPHDGVVRHAYHRRRKRKVQKGDGMPAGMHFASVAKDDDISVEIWIPEREYQTAMNAKKLVVQSPSSDERFPVTVTSVAPFPQTVGFLKGDDSLRNAREKIYVVTATFDSKPEGLAAGLEVSVEMP